MPKLHTVLLSGGGAGWLSVRLTLACFGWLLPPSKTINLAGTRKGPGSEGAPPAASPPSVPSKPAPASEPIQPSLLVHADGLIPAPPALQARGIQKIHPGWLPYLVRT